MNEMNIERACEILNEAKWQGRGNWEEAAGTSTIVSGWGPDPDNQGRRGIIIHIDIPDAIAIAQGILDRKRVVELEAGIAVFNERLPKIVDSDDPVTVGEYLTASVKRYYEQNEEIAELRAELAQVTQEWDALKTCAFQAQEMAKEIAAQLAALRLAVEPFMEVARQIPQMEAEAKAAPTTEHGPAFDLEDLIAAAMPEPEAWRALLATEQKEGKLNPFRNVDLLTAAEKG